MPTGGAISATHTALAKIRHADYSEVIVHSPLEITNGAVMFDANPISAYCFSHPMANLPASGSRHEPEAAFAEAFAMTYYEKAKSLHHGSGKTQMLLVREIPINGFGIADVLAVAWRPSSISWETAVSVENLEARQPTVRAFEAKLKDWKKGLMQAYRYGHFADASILVLPLHKIPLVSRRLETFHTLEVGLWGFDRRNSNIRAVYTPRPSRRSIRKYRLIALQRVLDSATAQPSD